VTILEYQPKHAAVLPGRSATRHSGAGQPEVRNSRSADRKLADRIRIASRASVDAGGVLS
jgi:hypothetical protein